MKRFSFSAQFFKRFNLVVILLTAFVFVSIIIWQIVEQENCLVCYGSHSRFETQHEMCDIEFYGQVFDQQNHPLRNAKVILKIKDNPFANPQDQENVRKHIVRTDSTGRFAVSKERGSVLYVDSIEQGGRRLSFANDDPQCFFFFDHLGKQRHVPDSQHPVVFTFAAK